MMRILACLMFLVGLTACGPRLSVHPDNPRSAKAAIQAWADGYNSDNIEALAQLVHPRQRTAFKKARRLLTEQLKVWRIDRFLLGQAVHVNNEFWGREVSLELHDGRRGKQVAGIVVETKGRWWLWTY